MEEGSSRPTSIAADGRRGFGANRLLAVAFVAILVVSLLAVPAAGSAAPPGDESLALMTDGVDHTIHVKKTNGAANPGKNPDRGNGRSKGKSGEGPGSADERDRGDSEDHTPQKTATSTPNGGQSGADRGASDRDDDDDDDEPSAADAPGRSAQGGNGNPSSPDPRTEKGGARGEPVPAAGKADRGEERRATSNPNGARPASAVPARAVVTTGHDPDGQAESGPGGPPGIGSRGDRNTVHVDVRDAAADTRISIDVSHPRTADDEVALDAITTDVHRGGEFSMAITSSRDRLPGSPAFHRDDGAEAIQRIRVAHSIPNDAVADVTVTFRIAKDRLRETDTDPESVALYRYAGETWSALETRLVGETRKHFSFEAASPGLSEFAVGAKRPAFDLWSAGIEDASISAGDTIRVSGRVTNTGSADGSFDATLVIAGSVVAREAVTIAKEGTRQVNFEVRMDRAGSHRVVVNGQPAGTVTVGPGDRSLDEPDRPWFIGAEPRQWLASVMDLVDAGFGPVTFFVPEIRTG